jgi:hypothetical protein
MMRTRAFAEALAEAEKIITSAPHITSEQDLAEGYDYLAGSIQASLRLACRSPARPRTPCSHWPGRIPSGAGRRPRGPGMRWLTSA